MYQHKLAVKNVLADVSSVSPSSEERALTPGGGGGGGGGGYWGGGGGGGGAYTWKSVVYT